MSPRIFHEDSFDQRWFRSAVDLAICFVMAVILLRTFVLEGYLISTGSMAPGLLGFHRRIQCPSCQFDFAFGVSFDDSVASAPGVIHEPEGARRYATCPNCGQINIDVSGVPNSHGDQLLVQKHVYDLRMPRRWEPVVFHNPASPGEAYVKRVVGLPGDRIRIINGDVYINDAIARKDYAQQQWMRIPVCDMRYLADADDWQLPWELDDRWKADAGTLKLSSGPDAESSANPQGVHWIRFRNWRWFGGHHVAETPLSAQHGLADWNSLVARYDALPLTWTSRVHYDEDREVLQCEGVMPDDLQQEMLRQPTSAEFRQAVYRLAALSHLAPVTDRCGYNAMVSSPEYIVGDLMLRAALSWDQAPDAIRVQVPVESETFELILHPQQRTVQLIHLDERQVVREAVLQDLEPVSGELRDPWILEVSNIDRQVLVALNGTPCFPALLLDPETIPEETLEATVSTIIGQKIDTTKAAEIMIRLERQKRWALGVQGEGVRVSELEMYRDVFYTPGRRKHAIDAEFRIPAACYFVQGDNSPVSSDSRSWLNPCVPHGLLIGKPFLVHLPSRPAVLQLGGRQLPIRVPEWSRIRYIR